MSEKVFNEQDGEYEPYVRFYLKCQNLNTNELTTYVFKNEQDLLQFAQRTALKRWAIISSCIRFYENYQVSGGRIDDSQREFSRDDIAFALKGEDYMDYPFRQPETIKHE